jgi:hypothetical protein
MLNRLHSLRKKHEILNAKIDHEQNRRRPDMIKLQTMKKIRLRYKEEIAMLEARLLPHAA